MSFGVMLVEGIVGGFAPPTPKKIIQIQNLDEGATITQQTLVPESGNDYHMQSANVSTEELASIGEKIKQTLKDLPTEHPPGSEDIYGLDIAIRFASDDFEWINGK
ncbi:hypothetical protein CU098_008256 [Rhizopus stolonifer]|uniref:Uncharacterized protein n=1 Tax=Rhizopus stolonifer TaxID=4846 RepID=A0A367KUI1_RHIST|nr:hypothetical protein CU098_008256 [Rhizopus stolonifer]